MLSYIFAVFGILALLGGGTFVALVDLAAGIGAFGIANEKRWGYRTDITATSLIVALDVLVLVLAFSLWSIINSAFAIVLLFLLLHPQSREYQKIWFR